jgi:hypothetical protein
MMLAWPQAASLQQCDQNQAHGWRGNPTDEGWQFAAHVGLAFFIRGIALPSVGIKPSLLNSPLVIKPRLVRVLRFGTEKIVARRETLNRSLHD